MSYDKESIYKTLIEDYIKSINSLQKNLNTTQNVDSRYKISKQIEGYKEQLSKLKQAV